MGLTLSERLPSALEAAPIADRNDTSLRNNANEVIFNKQSVLKLGRIWNGGKWYVLSNLSTFSFYC